MFRTLVRAFSRQAAYIYSLLIFVKLQFLLSLLAFYRMTLKGNLGHLASIALCEFIITEKFGGKSWSVWGGEAGVFGGEASPPPPPPPIDETLTTVI